MPRAATLADIAHVRDCFVNSAKRAVRIGFDAIELHYAHGYLAAFVSVAGVEPSHRPVRRLAGEPHAVRPRDRACGARGGAAVDRARRAHHRQRLARRRPHARRCGDLRKALKTDGLDYHRRVVRRRHRRHPQPDRPGLQRADRRTGQDGGRHRHPRRRSDHHAVAGRGHRRRGQGRHGRAWRARCSTIRAGAGMPAWSSAPRSRACRSICAPAPKLWAPAAQRAARRERAPMRQKSRDQRRAAVGRDHGDRRDRRHGQGRHLPAHAHRSRPAGARLVQGARRGARLPRHGRRHGRDVRAPRGQRGRAADRVRQPSRHPADRRQVRRRARRARRARSAAHAGRGRLRDLRADRGGELDQRGGLALCARDGRVRRVFAGRWKRTGRRRSRIATA